MNIVVKVFNPLKLHSFSDKERDVITLRPREVHHTPHTSHHPPTTLQGKPNETPILYTFFFGTHPLSITHHSPPNTYPPLTTQHVPTTHHPTRAQHRLFIAAPNAATTAQYHRTSLGTTRQHSQLKPLTTHHPLPYRYARRLLPLQFIFRHPQGNHGSSRRAQGGSCRSRR